MDGRGTDRCRPEGYKVPPGNHVGTHALMFKTERPQFSLSFHQITAI